MSADALIEAFEAEKSRALGNALRREAGLYYTPPAVAAQVVDLLLRHGGVRSGRVLDPCAGAGAFLVAAARAGLTDLHGIDLDPAALRVARRALRLCGVRARLTKGDALRVTPREPADLLVSNPPYGHLADARERAFLARAFPALRGGEIDRYAGFLLRALQLVRPGGAAALLVPDTWMFLARAGPLREEVLRAADLAAVVDLGKPFAAAKDTRVQAVVLVRKPASRRSAFVGRGMLDAAPCGVRPSPAKPAPPLALSPAPREELLQTARRGWFLYRTRGERLLCAAMDATSVTLGLACEVGYGMRTGNNPRHVVQRAPRSSEVGLVGGEDVVPFALRWRPKTLVAAERLLPLVSRQLGRARVAVQRIRTNSRAPWARWLEAAPVPGDLVCLDSLSTLASDSAELLWALLALLSSVALQRYHRLRTTDVNVKPSALRELPVPRGLMEAPGELAALAKERAGVTGMSDPLGMMIPGGGEGPPKYCLYKDRARARSTNRDAAHLLDRRIDASVYALFGLHETEVEAAERGFWGERFPEEIQLLEQFMSDPRATLASMEGT